LRYNLLVLLVYLRRRIQYIRYNWNTELPLAA